MPAKKCPVCGVAVKLENLEKHVREQHPRSRVDLESILTDEERRTTERIRQASATPPITRKGARLVAIVAVATAAILVFVIVNPFGDVGPGIGQVAPDFTLGTSTGGTVTLTAFRGSPVLLEFMDVDCEFCRQEAPVLASVFSNYSALGARFVSVDIDFLGLEDTAARIEDFRAQHGTAWSYGMDSQGNVARSYGLAQGPTPTTFILDRNGVVHKIFTGRASNGYADYAAALEALP